MEIQLDAALQALDPNAQQVIVNTAQQYERDKQTAAPQQVAPMDAGRPGDEQYPAQVDKISLLNSTIADTASVYDIEITVAGSVDTISVVIDNDGSVAVRPTD